MAALDRAVALAEVDHVPVRVGEHLHLDVPRVLEVPLDIDGRVGEIRLPLPLRGLERLRRLLRRADDLHPLAPAARRGLDQERVADLRAERHDLLGRADRVGRAGDDRHAGRLHRLARARLRAHQLDRGGRRPDPRQARALDGARERGVLGEESVAGMYRLRARPWPPPRAACRRRDSSRPRSAHRARGPRPRRPHEAHPDRRRSRRQPLPHPARAGCGRSGGRSRPCSQPGLCRTHSVFSRQMSFADQLTVARAISVPIVVALFAIPFPHHELLGDRRLLRGDGDRLVRRPDRAPHRPHLVVRVAARPRRRQAARDVDADRAARPGRLPRLDGGGDRRRASS